MLLLRHTAHSTFFGARSCGDPFFKKSPRLTVPANVPAAPPFAAAAWSLQETDPGCPPLIASLGESHIRPHTRSPAPLPSSPQSPPIQDKWHCIPARANGLAEVYTFDDTLRPNRIPRQAGSPCRPQYLQHSPRVVSFPLPVFSVLHCDKIRLTCTVASRASLWDRGSAGKPPKGLRKKSFWDHNRSECSPRDHPNYGTWGLWYAPLRIRHASEQHPR